MRRMRFVGVRFVVFGIVWVAFMGLLVLVLWNALLPAILSAFPPSASGRPWD